MALLIASLPMPHPPLALDGHLTFSLHKVKNAQLWGSWSPRWSRENSANAPHQKLQLNTSIRRSSPELMQQHCCVLMTANVKKHLLLIGINILL